MSTQSGPGWYPSRQFTHTPPIPGAPASPPLAEQSAPAPDARPGLRGFLRTLLRRG